LLSQCTCIHIPAELSEGHKVSFNRLGLTFGFVMVCCFQTQTMEAWDHESGSGTMSHPWNAAPAELIPHHLMGLSPLAPAFRRVRMAPHPSTSLSHASLTYPTLRGTFMINVVTSSATVPAFERGSLYGAAASHADSVAGAGMITSVTVTVTVPGNTLALVCVPIYLCGTGGQSKDSVREPASRTMGMLAATTTLSLDGVPVAGAVIEGGTLCLPHDITGSGRVVKATCA
jgi:hypothetical protein